MEVSYATAYKLKKPIVLPFLGASIVQAAGEHGCDLILMITPRTRRDRPLLAGSVTHAVLARGRLPMLVMH